MSCNACRSRTKSVTYDVVAGHIGIAGVDEETNTTVDEVRQQLSAVAGTVALERERLVDLHVAALEVDIRVDTELLLGRGQVHPRLNPLQLLVA